ncbi:drug/metabolite transporter (DMT)-like permease [Rhodobium orientis]|nr:DMT family transporter [Rhodobium orientis]MBB4302802.1 drug/metabolite transporter (DMT)-like permease [Rhodobium orientis]
MTVQSENIRLPGRMWGRRLWSVAPLLLALANLFWAGNFIIGRAVADMPGGLDPWGLAYWRWLVAFVLIFPFCVRQALRELPVILANLPMLCLFGLLSVTLYNTLIYLGLEQTTALNALLLQSTMPLAIMAMGYLLFRDTISSRQGIGLASSLAGVLVILTHGSLDRLSSVDLGSGSLYVLVAVLGNACYFALLRKRPRLSAMSFLFVIFGLGLVFLTPCYFLWSRPMARPVAAGDVALILYLAVCASILALLFFNRGVELIGANRASPYLHLMPVIGSVLSIVILGEQIRAYHLVGIAMVGFGLWLSRPRRPRATAQSSP